MNSYRIIYKWWLFGVYKVYPDGREFIIEWFTTRKQAEDFIKTEKEKTEQ